MKNDNKMHRKDTIQYWINRIDETSDIKKKKKTGRPKLLDDQKVKMVIDTIKKNPKKRYNKIRRILLEKGVNIERRTLNNYALKNDFREFLSYRFFFNISDKIKYLSIV